MKQKLLRKNKQNLNQTGFTLIEIMLYLGIVGLVIIIGMSAIGGRSSQVQFTDSMRDLHGYITSQYSEFVSGVKPYETGCTYDPLPDTTPNIGTAIKSDGTCILFGKVFLFEDDPTGDNTIVNTYNLVGRKLENGTVNGVNYNTTDCNANDLRCVNPYVLDPNSPRKHQILWGTQFIRGNESTHTVFGNGNILQLNLNKKRDNVRGFGWLKDPVSNSLIPIIYGTSVPNPTTADQFNSNYFKSQDQSIYRSYAKDSLADGAASPRVALNGEFNSAFCFRGPNGQIAMLVFGEGESQAVVNLTFSGTTFTHECTAV